jgi:TonB-dependent SusC/RagA subfamily outer membrane receptor
MAGCATSRSGGSDGAEAVARNDADTVAGDDEAVSRTRTLAEMLSRVPGVRVLERDGRLMVRIRGSASFLAGESPLVLVDGMVYNGPLNGINPFAIDEITVLKNADETAPYGARGANGVILIRTKSPGG